jgi:uncharacterized delta-60 repeat protein
MDEQKRYLVGLLCSEKTDTDTHYPSTTKDMKKRMILASLFFGMLSLQAQNDADRDAGFNVTGVGTLNAGGTGQQFSKVTPLPGGKVLATGAFYSAATTTPSYSRLFRLNDDGSFDNTFNVGGEGASGIIAATAVQPDGKILIGGGFPLYNGVAVNGIARINPDGSVDPTFNAGTGFSSILPPPWVRSIAVQPDGKIIVGGGFTIFNGISIAGVLRLNADGSLDATFSPGSGPNNIVEAVAIQPDGKIVVGGLFGSFNGVSTGKLTRLNSDGSLDQTFTSATSGDILRVIIQPDGKILASGVNFYRLESNGSLDVGFTTDHVNNNSFYGLGLQQDGKIVLSGAFKTYLTVDSERIVRLNVDGTVDSGFDTEIGFSTNPQHLAIQSDGKILVFGGYEYKGVQNLITRIVGTPTTSIVEHSDYRLNTKVFPNPATDYVTVELPGTGLSDATNGLVLIDLQGRIIRELMFTGTTTTLNISNVAKGVYTLKTISPHGESIKPLVIQ